MTTKVTAQQLYAEMDKTVPGWRRAGYPSFDSAVEAAGKLAVDLCASWRAGFERKTNSRLAAADARKATNERLAQEIREKEDAEDDSPVFDRGPAGRMISVERRDEPGRELVGLSDEEGEARGAQAGRIEDSLYHPDRPANAKPWTMKPFSWNPVAPRSYAGSPKCY